MRGWFAHVRSALSIGLAAVGADFVSIVPVWVDTFPSPPLAGLATPPLLKGAEA